MFQWTFRDAPDASKILTEDALLAELVRMEEDGFEGAPLGPLTLEARDEQGRVLWRACYNSVLHTRTLLRQLREERAWRLLQAARAQAGVLR